MRSPRWDLHPKQTLTSGELDRWRTAKGLGSTRAALLRACPGATPVPGASGSSGRDAYRLGSEQQGTFFRLKSSRVEAIAIGCSPWGGCGARSR